MRVIFKEQQEQKEPCNVTMKLNQLVYDSVTYKLLVEPTYVILFFQQTIKMILVSSEESCLVILENLYR